MTNKQDIIDYYVSFKDTIEAEIAKPLEDSLVGITADSAYIAGLETALRLADESARYVINKINELATPAPEPQESIFDADGWCWDMSLLKTDGTPVLLFDSHEGVSVGWRTDAGIYGHTDLINLTEEYPKREILDKIIQGYVIKWEAWKPFQYPTGGKK
jgi:hypothetical protein